VKILQAPPSAGILFLYTQYKLRGRIDKSSVYGFSSGSDHYFNKKVKVNSRHNWTEEKRLIKSLL